MIRSDGTWHRREFARNQRRSEVILNNWGGDSHIGATDLEGSTMCFFGDNGTGTGVHADVSTGKNFAIKIIPPCADVKVR